MMLLLVHCRDNASDATGGLHPERGVETTMHLLLDLSQRHRAFGHIMVKRYSQCVPTGQCLGQALLRTMPQALACTLCLWPALATGRQQRLGLFCYGPPALSPRNRVAIPINIRRIAASGST
jgi:hypothetical protein